MRAVQIDDDVFINKCLAYIFKKKGFRGLQNNELDHEGQTGWNQSGDLENSFDFVKVHGCLQSQCL